MSYYNTDVAARTLEPFKKTLAKRKKKFANVRRQLESEHSRLEGLHRRTKELKTASGEASGDTRAFEKLKTALGKTHTAIATQTDLCEVLTGQLTIAEKDYADAELQLQDALHGIAVAACEQCSADLSAKFDELISMRDAFIDETQSVHRELALPYRRSDRFLYPRCLHPRISNVAQIGADADKEIIFIEANVLERVSPKPKRVKPTRPEPELVDIPELGLSKPSPAAVAMALAELESGPSAVKVDSPEGRANRDWPNG